MKTFRQIKVEQMFSDAERRQRLANKIVKEAKTFNRKVTDQDVVKLIKNMLAFHRM